MNLPAREHGVALHSPRSAISLSVKERLLFSGRLRGSVGSASVFTGFSGCGLRIVGMNPRPAARRAALGSALSGESASPSLSAVPTPTQAERSLSFSLSYKIFKKKQEEKLLFSTYRPFTCLVGLLLFHFLLYFKWYSFVIDRLYFCFLKI